MKYISIKGAKTHNLKNIDLDIPRNKFIVLTGLSGSGKSSLAFDTLYAEGQRRYVESLSTYARQFLSLMEKPDVEHIYGLSPAISIDQKTTSYNPRSTVGTVTEIYDYIRLLYARVGSPLCPVHKHQLSALSIEQITDQILKIKNDTAVMLLAPIVKNSKGAHAVKLQQLKMQGFIRIRIDGVVTEIDDVETISDNKKHNIEVVVDRFKVNNNIRQRLAESIEVATTIGNGTVLLSYLNNNIDDVLFSTKFSCPVCNFSMPDLDPKLFSFNSPLGACATCNGLGIRQFFDEKLIIPDTSKTLAQGAIIGWGKNHLYYFQLIIAVAKHYKFSVDTPFKSLSKEHKQILLHGSDNELINFEFIDYRNIKQKKLQHFEGVIPNLERRYKDAEYDSVRKQTNKFINKKTCDSCNGSRLCKEASNVFIGDKNISDLTNKPIEELLKDLTLLSLTGSKKEISKVILKEISTRLEFLVNVGLKYLSLSRSASTLSGGEAQRIKLASQIGAGLVGVMYVLDEPSIGLHQADNQKLINSLQKIKDLGNTVIVVEHDKDTIEIADYIVDIGPGAGRHGGEIVATGTAKQIMKIEKSITGQYLSGKKTIATPKTRRKIDTNRIIKITNCSGNNLKSVDFELPAGLFTCVTGISGSGKSTLINGTLYPVANHILNRSREITSYPYSKVIGFEMLEKCINIDQSPIGRTPRSNPATYTGIFTIIRELFANTNEAKSRGYKIGRFSFNVAGGRCESCQGDGEIKVEMHFLPDIYVPCNQCNAKRYNRETLDIKYKGKNIYEVLEMTVEEALEFFVAVPSINKKLQTMIDVGLSYMHLGQNAVTLSGGEAQRLKLSKELARRDTSNTLYILDEPTTGLHFEDIRQLLEVLKKLNDFGNTIVVIEHNLDVIKTADWVIDLGPEGGEGGGEIIATGTPEAIAKNKKSKTGWFLAEYLN
jgi:excinuclease ABC subunit A